MKTVAKFERINKQKVEMIDYKFSFDWLLLNLFS